MTAWCLPPQFSTKFIDAIKSGAIDPGKLVDMSSEARAMFFSNIVGDENAHEVNAQFESKMLLNDVKAGMVSWVKSIAGLSEPIRRDMLSKIEKMEKILNPAEQKDFLADLVAKKLGTRVTMEQAAKITQLAKVAVAEREKSVGSKFGVTANANLAAKALEHYVQSLEPTTVAVEVARNVVTTLRNFTLSNLATPIKATIGQVESSALEAVVRRIGARQLSGAAPETISAAGKDAWDFFQKTGSDPLAMESYEDTGKLGEHSNFDVREGLMTGNPLLHKIESATRTAAKVTTKVVIDYGHVLGFTKVSQMTFLDAVHISATNLATVEGKTGAALKSRVQELILDAVKIKPQTQDGAILRSNAQTQAARVTGTNATWLAGLALGMKNVLNGKAKIVFKGEKVGLPKIGLGDLLMPVAKIPANVIWNGIENAGVGYLLGVNNIWRGNKKLSTGNDAVKAEGLLQVAKGWQQMGRTFGSMAIAAFFASMFDPQEDFREDKYGHSFVKMGGYWIDTEYVSFMSPAMAGMMRARQQVNEPDSYVKMAQSYLSGATKGLLHAPGVDTAETFFSSISTNQSQLAGLWDYVQSRATPAIVHSLTQDRWLNRLLAGGHGFETDDDVDADKDAAAERAAQRREGAEEYRAE